MSALSNQYNQNSVRMTDMMSDRVLGFGNSDTDFVEIATSNDHRQLNDIPDQLEIHNSSPDTHGAIFDEDEEASKKKKRGKKRNIEKQSMLEDNNSGSCCAGPNGKKGCTIF